MKSITVILLTFTLLLGNSWSFDVPNVCKELQPPDCVTCSSPFSKKLLTDRKVNVLLKPLKDLEKGAFLEDKVESLIKTNESLKKSLISLIRTVRDGSKEPSYKTSINEIKNIKADFERLTVLSKETISLQKKFDVCINNCSATRKIEIQDELELIQKIKIAIFIKQPILANKKFEERMLRISESMIDKEELFSDKIFEEDLSDALYDNFEKIKSMEGEYYRFQNDGKKPYNRAGNEVNIREYLVDITSRFPGIMADVVKSSFRDNDFINQETRDSACFYANQFKIYTDRKEYTEMAVDVGLFALPLLTGPFGIELALGVRLSTWGVRSLEARKAMTSASIIFQSGIIAKDLSQLKELSETCRQHEVNFLSMSDQAHLIEFRDCQKDLGEKIFASELSLISAGATSISLGAIKFLNSGVQATKLSLVAAKEVKNTNEISSYISKNGFGQLKKGQVGLEFKTPNHGVFSVMDLSTLSNVTDPAVKKIPKEYWGYVGGIYNERLKLSKKEIENFVKSSVELSPRTKLIINTDKSPLAGKIKINGGVGIVHSQKVSELLPLEKATGIKIDRKPNEKIVEIVRLTVGKNVEEAEKISAALISQVSGLVNQDKNISRLFIFTSKVHARLYKRMGVPMKHVREVNQGRDVIIEFSPSEFNISPKK